MISDGLWLVLIAARAGVVTLRPGGLEVDAESGTTVKYRAKASGVIGDDGEIAMSAWMSPSEAAEMGVVVTWRAVLPHGGRGDAGIIE